MGLGRLGIEGDGLAVALQGFEAKAGDVCGAGVGGEFFEGDAEIEVGRGPSGAELKDLPVGIDGGREELLLPEHIGEVELGFHIIGLELDGAAKRLDGGGELATAFEDAAEVGVALGIVGIELEGLVQAGDREVDLVLIEGEPAEEVPGGDVGGIGGEELAVEVLGLGELAGLMGGEGEGEHSFGSGQWSVVGCQLLVGGG